MKLGGTLYLSLPDKGFSFDANRPVTTVEHLHRDYREGPEWSKRQHFEEWTRYTEQVTEDAFHARVDELIRTDYSIHFHVWTRLDMLDLIRLRTVCSEISSSNCS